MKNVLYSRRQLAILLVALALSVGGQGLSRNAGVESVSAGAQGPLLTSILRPGLQPHVGGARYWALDAAGSRDRNVPLGRDPVQVPILMYHYIRTPPHRESDELGFTLSTSPEDFRRQMDWLRDSGFHAVTVADVREYLAGRYPLPSRPVVISFDDGYADLYTTAFPILRAHRFTAVAYIVAGFVDHPGYVTHDQVVDMDRYGLEIGSHTISHPDLTRLQGVELAQEVSDSRTWLQRMLGHPVLDFCYPAGRHSAVVELLVQQAGYKSATTTAEGTARGLSDRFHWTRTRVEGGEPMVTFIDHLRSADDSVSHPSGPAFVLPISLPITYGRDGSEVRQK